jgi:hypothetical protein
MAVNISIQELKEDAAVHEQAAIALFAGVQNGQEYRQNEIFAENGARCALKAEAELRLAALLESGWPYGRIHGGSTLAEILSRRRTSSAFEVRSRASGPLSFFVCSRRGL